MVRDFLWRVDLHWKPCQSTKRQNSPCVYVGRSCKVWRVAASLPSLLSCSALKRRYSMVTPFTFNMGLSTAIPIPKSPPNTTVIGCPGTSETGPSTSLHSGKQSLKTFSFLMVGNIKSWSGDFTEGCLDERNNSEQSSNDHNVQLSSFAWL